MKRLLRLSRHRLPDFLPSVSADNFFCFSSGKVFGNFLVTLHKALPNNLPCIFSDDLSGNFIGNLSGSLCGKTSSLWSRMTSGSLAGLLCLLMLISLFATTACQPKQISLPSFGPGDAKLAWTAFVARSEQSFTRSGPFRFSGSLRYTLADGTSERVSCIVWGNDANGPLRLDLTAGIGTVVGRAQETNEGFLAYVPSEKAAYSHDQAGSSLESLGVPIPLSLSELTNILIGNAGKIFLPDGATVEAVPETYRTTENGTAFTILTSRLSGELELANNGEIVSWRDTNLSGWTFTFTPSPVPLKPKRLVIEHKQGYKAIITVTDIVQLGKPFTEKELMLTIPPGTTLHGL